MKKQIGILSLIVLGCISLNGQTTDHTNFLNGLISAYSMEGSSVLSDELNLNNGTVNGATLVPGNLGNALNFTGSQSTMATVPTSTSLDLDGAEMSLMVDIYPTANGQSGYSVIFQKGVGSTGDNIYSVAYKSNNTIRFRNYVNGTRRDFISTTTAPLNTWSRIICVWKSGEAKIIRINSATDTDTGVYTGTQDVSTDRDLTIGSYDLAEPAAARSFLGNIDNIMIWNRALTTEEQNTLINENLGFSDFNAGGGSDTENPTAPTLSSTGQTETTADLSWSGATDNVGVTGYNIYKDGALEASSTSSPYTATGLTAATTYSFTVSALDAAGNESPQSTAVSVTTDSSSGGGGGSSVWLESGSTASYTGQVGIGTATVPSEYKMAIDGKLITEEVRVEISDTWPDYVFDEDYDLPTLEEVEKHIEEKGYLPNIPSAKEVEVNGIELGEMDKLLLEKIEEQMLYILQLKKEINLLNKANNETK